MYHANVIAENIRFLSSSMLFRHWRKAQLYELASHFVIRIFEVNENIVSQGEKVPFSFSFSSSCDTLPC